jgi:transposase
MAETRGKFDQDFRDGAVRIVRETGRPNAELAMERDVLKRSVILWVKEAMGR